MDRLSDEEFLEFVYCIKRILNSSVKTNAEKNYHNVPKLLTSTAPAATTVAIVPLCVNMAPFGKP